MLGPADYALLPALDALLSEESVTRAALRLGISQPALSTKLARLRDLTGDPLLVPSVGGRGMVATPKGLLLRGQAREAISAAEAALRNVSSFDPQTASATLRILANDNAASLMLSVRLARVVASSAKRLRVALLRPDGRRIADRLESGDVDLAISAEDQSSVGPGLHSRFLLRDHFATAQRRSHPRGRGCFDLTSFCAADHLLVSDHGGFDGPVDMALRSAGHQRRVALSVHSYALAPAIVARSDLLVTLPRRLLEQHGGIDIFDPPVDLEKVTIRGFWHERTNGDPLHSWIRERLLELEGD